MLAQLAIDDTPHTLSGYERSAWPTWLDVDGDGCDARDEALRAASRVKATMGAHCKVLSGSWVSAYDGLSTTDPGTLDIDHVVPLANAYISGAWSWNPAQRRLYANDQANLWPVSATSNRSKGDQSPDEWRPPRYQVWCLYAERWASIKVRWHLAATTSERDALGQMLDTCARSSTGPSSPPSTSTTVVPVTSAASPTTAGTVFYANCAAARAAGAAPIYRSQPGYRSGLDRDHDGVACE